jgi:hypothetical protein
MQERVQTIGRHDGAAPGGDHCALRGQGFAFGVEQVEGWLLANPDLVADAVERACRRGRLIGGGVYQGKRCLDIFPRADDGFTDLGACALDP